MGGTPIVVGERGPELFVPQSAGKIVPNNVLSGSAGGSGGPAMQTVVNYNIQAVDAASFRSLVARDPSFIYAVTEQGRRSQPGRRAM
jgi:phage-related minor tail protein